MSWQTFLGGLAVNARSSKRGQTPFIFPLILFDLVSIWILAFRKIISSVRLTPFLFILLPLFIVGCGKHGEIILGPFSDNQLLMNTEFDKKLLDSLILTICLDSSSARILKETKSKLFKESLMRIFYELFPPGISEKKIITALEATGAQCQKVNNSKTNSTRCKLKKEYIDGLTGLHLLGWKIHMAILTVNSFEYLITTQDDHIFDVSVGIIESVCFEMDKKLYEQSKTVKPIRKL